ncbi:hypothetical protein GCM10007049_09750 [Echinicola pacifica]|uniref:Outer membrane insertion C-signal n=1 Tax=Echinicola pacifica TaxID=346377 RepID=A0A918PRD7_9BACT|nr:hypothetical protein [Echinicola pacifica]GGZ19400.1 hypothetical protein GCM10007049_09750 [Echinicola pacifica]
MKKFLMIAFTVFIISQQEVFSQISAGIYQQNAGTYMVVGSDPDEKMFGEGRLGAGNYIDVEGTFGYNFIQRDEVNFYSGVHLGVFDVSDGSQVYFGVPLGLLVKPFSASRNFGFVLEASPLIIPDSSNYLRAGIGMRYTFR